jgi:alpha-L-fucosidase
VVNVPPDNTGQLREHEVNAIIGLGKRLNIKKDKPLQQNGKFISINAPIVASSILNNDEAKFGAKWAVDGGMQTSWAAADTIAELVLNLDQNQPFNKISIFENQIVKVAKDQFTTYRTNRIQSYSIDIWLNNEWKTVFMSEEPMGDCKVIRFPIAYKTSKLRFKVLKASAPPSITELNVIYMDKSSK